eukprot:TRINITY_DN26721_c0_g1_i1.p1 TRINITY_DN26721_c0_g1~~TRINITY_DN26721_c0_g1_i1.p1  ORF type:complete len:118 (-),score=20.64 TRINITY_DN26721_c0_g1_i1:37-390(-)
MFLVGFCNVGWNLDAQSIQDDVNAFLYTIRPTMKSIYFAEEHKNGEQAIWNDARFGPVFGEGNDLWICDQCDVILNSGTNPTSFDFVSTEMCGGGNNAQSVAYCKITEYEVFGVEFY